ncbi:MAG: hypothetical protein LBK02_06300, partial [Treponema sp.]|nr:hypothetical protein [Treponema sp.]
WRPDWPEDFPPDAFSVNSGPPLSIVLEYGGDTLRLRRDREGRLREFPFYWDRAFIRFQADYDPAGRIRRLSAETPDWAADFPENFLLSGDTGPVRVNYGGTWFFALVVDAGFGFSETWYDAEGNFAAWYQSQIRRDGPSWRLRSLEFRGNGDQSREDYDYDSGGNITALNSPQGEFSAGYRNGRPVYWNRAPAAGSAATPEDTAAEAPEPPNPAPEQPGKFILQWDERGFLTAKRPQEGERGGEFRYEYETGGRGNWTKRRDTELRNGDDLLIPVFRGQYERRIFYTEE